jgi:hypothetical protein
MIGQLLLLKQKKFAPYPKVIKSILQSRNPKNPNTDNRDLLNYQSRIFRFTNINKQLKIINPKSPNLKVIKATKNRLTNVLRF